MNKNTNRRTILITLSLLLFLSSVSFTLIVKADIPTVYIDPQRITGADVGDTLTINVTVSDVTDLKAWEFRLYYKSSILNATLPPQFDETCLLEQHPDENAKIFPWIVNFTDNYNATHGLILASCTLYDVPDGVSGSGRLTWMEFKAVGSGDSPLDLTYVFPESFSLLFDSNWDPITHTTIDGIVHVGLRDVAITNMEAPRSVPTDSIVKINVTAENQGELSQTFDITLDYDSSPIETKSIIDMPGGGIQTLTFTWDVTSLPIGEYTLRATATQVPGEVDLDDNTYTFELYVGIRDVAVTNTVPSKTVTNDTTIYINVTVENHGEYTETFNVTMYYNAKKIRTQTVTNLTIGSAETLTFTWNTILVPVGSYLISTTATTVPGETNTEDNTHVYGYIIETIKGDVTGDRKVDIYDLYQFARGYDTTPEDPYWNPNCDLNDDGIINLADLFFAARNYNKEI